MNRHLFPKLLSFLHFRHSHSLFASTNQQGFRRVNRILLNEFPGRLIIKSMANAGSPEFFKMADGSLAQISPYFSHSHQPILFSAVPIANPFGDFSFPIYPSYRLIYLSAVPQAAQLNQTNEESQNTGPSSFPNSPISPSAHQAEKESQPKTATNIPLSQPPAKKHFISKPERNSKQDPRRNIVTNIGNQLLTFVTNKARCLRALRLLPEGSANCDLAGFFAYSRRLRSRSGYYLNYAKMKSIWYPK